MDQYNLTPERLSERIGKKRATIANFLRLLRLPAEVQIGLRDKRVDMGHARALLTIEKPALQLKLYNEILRDGLSVRKVEELAKAYQNGEISAGKKKATKKQSLSGDFDSLKNRLSSTFGTKVSLTCNESGKGKITFPFKDAEQLAELITLFDNLTPTK